MPEQRTLRPVPEPVLRGAEAANVAPPSPEDMARLQGAQVVLEPDSAAAVGARGVYDDIKTNEALRNAGYLEMGLDPHDPSGELTDPEGTQGAPVNRNVPYVSQAGDDLHCTMGEWLGEPTSYAYQWQIDGANVGTDEPDYATTAGDVGHTATCIVTATNAAGSTTAAPSNGVVIT